VSKTTDESGKITLILDSTHFGPVSQTGLRFIQDWALTALTYFKIKLLSVKTAQTCVTRLKPRL